MAEADSISTSGKDASVWTWQTDKWQKRQPRVWLVDDCAEDRTLVNRAIGDFCELQIFHTGASVLHAIASLSEPGSDTDLHSPDLVLLDFRMPRLSGPETLKKLRAQDTGRNIPVVVFSSSAAPADIDASYAAGCNSYVTKPSGWNDYRLTLQAIFRYWLDIAE